ncbi:SusC/RagA family TonB-linked outer membrane protein [Mucilaginibacter sp. OK098]|uniref:SusC/RagA family TonB-linked outer membrane protein n=1 Tax=Mucilaginibacter sp. OK098 TaxID=1855297 RepID=UPI000919891B|nr:SusC/RagA family TonB-linked outer membrane protein [Mucilaginibacter sp. OK098]SHM91972.1 TonB-linked outer membrane protein, SusC/RagA family [Mucilaginibacter sp. OK098]
MYKIYTNSLCWLQGRITKFLLIMKLTIVLLIVSLMQVNAFTYAQRVSLKKKEITLKQVFKEIKKQTGHDVLYQPNKLKASQKINADFDNSSLDEVMKACLQGMPLVYTFYENSIVIKEGTPAVNIQAAASVQLITVTGKVVDTAGVPLKGATVKVKKGNQSTVVDVNGTFTLKNVEENSILQISFIGYITQEIRATSGNILVKLKSQSFGLNEVVVLGGYGTPNAATEKVVSTVVTVSGAETDDKPVPNALDALQGRVPGLSILSGSGEPSTVPSIRLHGLGSLTSGTDPYVILDGTPIDLATVLTLNPNDIHDWKILKDATALSIYGAQAANGVIIINTNHGSFNKPATITLTSQYSLSSIASYKFFHSFMNAKELENFDVSSGLQTQAQLDAVLAAIPVKNADTKWYNYYYKRNAPTAQENVAISGGGGKTTYYISGGYLKSVGIAAESGYNRYNLRSNISSTVNKWTQVGLNMALTYDITHTNPFTANSTNGGLGMFAPPYASPYAPDGSRYVTIPGWGNRYDPYYRTSQNPINNSKFTFNPTAYVQVKPISGLTLKSQAGLNGYDFTNSTLTLPSYLGVGSKLGTNSESYERNVRKTFTNTAEYAFTVGAVNHITALAGQEYSDGGDQGFSASGQGLTDNRLILLGNTIASPRDIGSYNYEYVYNSYFGKLNYDFNEKYYAVASIRNDASSRFSVAHRSGTFWSGGLGWEAKKENFLKDVSWIDNLTLKANTGTSGNSLIGNYTSLALIGNAGPYNNTLGYNVTNPGSPYLTWEQHQKTTFGMNVAVLDRIRLDVSYYIDVTSQMLIDVPFPTTSGFTTITQNTGTLQNKGFDIDLAVDLWKDKVHNGYLTFFLKNEITHNKITKLFQGRSSFPQPGFLQAWVVGQPVNFYLPLFAGVNSQTGAPQWYLPGSNPSITRKDPKAVTSDFNSDALQQNSGIGQFAPSTGSFGFNGGYKGFSLEVMFYYALGKHLLSNDGYYFQNPNVYPVGYNAYKIVQNYWKKPGDVTQFPDINNYQLTQFDSSLIQDASFMRLKDLTLSYSVPKSLLEHTKVLKAFKIFLEGRNLFTITKYTGPDPEIDSNLSYGQFPSTKQYSLGLEATF